MAELAGLEVESKHHLGGLYSLVEEQTTLDIIRLSAEIATIGAIIFVSYLASRNRPYQY